MGQFAIERLLSSLSHALALGGDPESLATRGLSALTGALGAWGAWLRFRENGLGLQVAVGVDPPQEARLTPQEMEALSAGQVLAYRLPSEATGPASQHWAELGYQGLLLAPLEGEEGLLGTLALLFFEAVPEEGITALKEVLPLFGLILQYAQTKTELERRQSTLEALHRLDQAMLQGKSLTEIAHVGAQEARQLLGAKAATVSLVEGTQRRLIAAAGREVEPFVGQSASLEENPHAQVWRSGTPVVLTEIPVEGVPIWLSQLAPLGNALVLPLQPNDSILGFLGLYGLSNPRAAVALAKIFAAQLSLALLREQDREALMQRSKEQGIWLRALEVLSEAQNPEETAQLIIELAPELVGAEQAAVLWLEGDVLRVAAANGIWAPAVGQRLPSGRGISWVAIKEGTQVVADLAKDLRAYNPLEGQISLSGSGIVTRLPDPQGEGLGVLIVLRNAPAYTAPDTRWIEALAQAGAIALERARRDLEARLLLEGALLAAQENEPAALADGFARLFAQAVGGGRAAVWAHPERKQPWRLLGVSGVGEEIEPFRQADFDPQREPWAAWIQEHQAPLVVEDTAKPPFAPGEIEAAALQSYTVLSILGVPVGAFGVAYAEPGSRGKAFAAYEISLVERLGGMLAGALERHRLALAERRVRSALERLAQVPPGDLEALVQALGESLGMRWVFLDRLLAPDRALAIAVYGGEPLEYDLKDTPCADVFAGHFCEYHQGVRAYFPRDQLVVEMGAEAYLGTPLRGTDGQMLGILVAMHDAALSENEATLRREILLAYAQRAALELQQREGLARLEATARAHSLLRPAHSLQEVYEFAVEAALQETRATSALFLLYRGVEDCLEIVASAGRAAEVTRGQRMGREEGLVWRVLERGEALYLENAAESPEALFYSGPLGHGAYLGVPLRNAVGQVLGVLSADTAERGEGLFPEDRHFLLALAEAAGAAIARLEALQRAQGEAERFRALAELSVQLEALEDPERILEQALDALWRISGFQVALFGKVTPEGLKTGGMAGKPPQEWLSQPQQESYPLTRGLVGQVLQTGEALFVPFYPDHPLALPEWVNSGLKSIAYMPVGVFGQTVGILGLLDFRQAYQENPLPLLGFASRRLGRALEKAQTLQELRQAREGSLKGLGLALEYRDLETAGHTERVTALALRLAEALNLDEAMLTQLRWGAYLHDLGKLAIPDAILKKPGKLDPKEWERMKAHTIVGEEMARQMGFLPPATLEIIRHHHERWDGTGYPDALEGKTIPLLARIFALSDVYDALISERPYKPAWRSEEALAEIERQAGQQFDPELTKIFIRQIRAG
ncbi:hypothetical protein MGR01S_23510 [Meiothermus granaticius NBRC 107808]|nr:hypothetical protein MGR01S_23510 [Meiothermus granaticius NBRC 107808]